MTDRIFTADEANRTIPLVTRIVADIVSDYGQVASMAEPR
jgi:hypothetical protein